MSEKPEFNPIIDPASSSAQDMFARILQERIQAGALEEAITKQVDSLIKETAIDVFRSYSDLGKAIKDQLTKAIMPEIESIGDLPVYHDFVTNRLKLAAQTFYDERLGETLDQELKLVFSEVPEDLTLSFIINKILERSREYDDEPEGEITLLIEKTQYGSVHVSMDNEPGKSECECAYRLHLSHDKDSGNYKILSLKVDDKDAGEKLCFGRLYRIDKLLFNVYAMRGEIVIDNGFDADDYDHSWSEY